ncbi:pilus assembly protein TadG-related protein [Streptomyces sp. NPDC000410]|uniref:pilus assembly protein TadG-related protein n=1 Tax=Streptomyces sp. NPDC000410 TaxID=3154254 RepID=UPI0033330586
MNPKLREAGQAFPIYITVVASLLFLAFAYFVVGKAADKRNDAQGAADAAALAAAQDARDQLRGALLGSVLNPTDWEDLVEGRGFGAGRCFTAADRFAKENDSKVTACDPYFGSRWGFTVEVETLGSVGESVVPGTENKKGTARARAVIEPRCSFKAAPKPEDGEDPDEGAGNDKPVFPGTLTCDGTPIDLEKLDFFPEAADLFRVRLVDADD